MSNEKKRYTVQNGKMRGVANNQEVDKYTEAIRKYCSVSDADLWKRVDETKGN